MKKLISILMVVSLLLSAGSLCTFAAEEELDPSYWITEDPDVNPEDLPGTVLGFLGDTDENGKLNVKDATGVQKHVASVEEFEGIALNLADVDFSGVINVKDATAIQKWVAGINTYESYISHILYKAYDPDERLFGKWSCTMDVGEMINDFLPEYIGDPSVTKYFNIKSCDLTTIYEFFDDYSFVTYSEEESLTMAYESVKADLIVGTENYILAFIDENGYDLTVDDIINEMGYSSVEEYVDELFPMDTILGDAESQYGYYRTTPNGHLYLNEYTDTSYEFYTIEADKLTITGNNENLTPELYPIVLTKIK